VKIPIANIYFLLLYAWDVLEEADLVDVAADESTNVLELFGRILNSGVRHATRKGIRQDYLAKQEEVRGVRGRLLIDRTIRTGSLQRGITVCETDHLTPNTITNQILRSTIRLLVQAPVLDETLRAELLGIYRRLAGIDILDASPALIRRIQLHRNPPFYRFLLSVCELVSRQVAVRPEDDGARFRGFDETKLLSEVFERFLFNFYRREQKTFTVKREQIRWYPVSGSPADLELLPVMRTDVSLQSASRQVVIDAKFYSETLRPRFDKQRIREAHLYQLFAYLSNIRAAQRRSVRVEGMLLYPQVDEAVSAKFELHDLPIRVETIDLTQSSKQIKQSLLALVEPTPIPSG
jgi:5-methylcytosine-specific restriction enzyme subunit McrC